MIDMDRIAELEEEIGGEDLRLIFRVFLGEAEETLAALAPGTTEGELARAAHFLRSGALNIGFTGIAGLAVQLEAGGGMDLATAVAELRAALETVRTELRLPRA